MPTSAHYISVNNCKNQPPKAVQPATKQSTGLFLPNLQTNLEQLVVVRVQFKKTKRTEHIRQYTILVGLQGCATCYETVRRTVSSKFVFAKFGAACRWFESINSERKADTQKRIGFSLAPQVGLEPTTLRLTAACSTN